jgi:hypothetical protein
LLLRDLFLQSNTLVRKRLLFSKVLNAAAGTVQRTSATAV